jgi:hypothetical protein
MPVFLIPYVIRAGILALIISFGYLGYSKIKQVGFEEAEAKYTLIIKEYENNLNKKVDVIENLSNTLVIENRENSALLAQDLELIKSGIKKKPLVIIKDGECIPSTNFSEAFGKLNQRANQSIKDKKP